LEPWNLGEGLKAAIVEGAVAGGGLPVIANAPNPAGQSLLSRFFDDGVSPLNLLLRAIIPTLVAVIAFRFI
jgi:putative Na+/H+ antiporter